MNRLFPLLSVDAVKKMIGDGSIIVNDDLAQQINEGGVAFIDREILHTAEFSSIAGTRSELITSNNDQLPGFSDFNGKKLDANTLQVIDTVKFGYAEAATGNGAALNYKNLASSVPVDMLAARLRVEQRGRVVVDKLISELVVSDTTTTNGAYVHPYQGTPLRRFAYLLGNVETDIYLIAPDGETIEPSATLGHIRLIFAGIGAVTSK